MAKSIIQARTGPADRECYLCREEAERNGYYGELCHTGLHKHHFIYGRLGYVCEARHHEHGPEAPHCNSKVDEHLKRIAQQAFEKKYGHDLWMQEFGKNYLEK